MTALEHFLRLARQGRRRGSSSGEYAAHKLASCVAMESATLDDAAFAGFVEFLILAREKPMTARDMLDGIDSDAQRDAMLERHGISST